MGWGALIAVSIEGQTPAAENGSNWWRRIDWGVGSLMYTQGPMNIEGVAEKPVAAASESLDERLVHGPGRGIVEKYRGAKAIEEPDLQMIIIRQILAFHSPNFIK